MSEKMEQTLEEIKGILIEISGKLDFQNAMFEETYKDNNQASINRQKMSGAPMAILKVMMKRAASQIPESEDKRDLMKMIDSFDGLGG